MDYKSVTIVVATPQNSYYELYSNHVEDFNIND